MSERRGESEPLIRSHAKQTSSVVPRKHMGSRRTTSAKVAKEDGIFKTGVSAVVDL